MAEPCCAWTSCRQNLVLGQAKVSDKSNEITAIPKLLNLLTIKGSTITIDAMGCQREIAAKIIAKEADYVLTLKGNQGTLREDVGLFLVEQKARKFADCVADRHQAVEKSHGRIETRVVTAIGNIGWLQARHKWPGLTSIVVVESRRETRDRCQRELRFYVASLPPDAKRLGDAVRSHWGIENGFALDDGYGVPRRRVPYPQETMRRPTSPPSSTWRVMSCARLRARTASASNAKWLAGTMTSWRASLPGNKVHPIPPTPAPGEG